MTDIQCVFQSMTGKGSIYISNYAAAQNLKLLQSKDIKAVLSVAKSGLLKHNKQDIPYYLYLPAHDHEEYDIYRFFNQTYDFIELSRKYTNVLVHCMAGVSRSVTIVIAYLLKKYKCSLGEVIIMLQRKRNKINPNKGFIEQLKKYALQQGLKCNFDFQQVPIRRDKSYSRDNKTKSKQKSNKMSYNTLISPIKRQSQKEKQDNAEKQQENTGQIHQNVQEKINEQKQVKVKRLITKEMQLTKPYDKYQSFKVANVSRQRRDQPSNGKSPKKYSIEEKITKIKNKILQNESKRSVEKQKNQTYDKQNESLARLKSRAQHNKNLSQYFSLYAKTHPLSIKIAREKSLSKERLQKHEQGQIIFQICSYKTQGKVLNRNM